MKKVLLVMVGMGLVGTLGGCQAFMDLTVMTFRSESRDDGRSEAERRARNERSRERAKGARLQADGYVRKGE